MVLGLVVEEAMRKVVGVAPGAVVGGREHLTQIELHQRQSEAIRPHQREHLTQIELRRVGRALALEPVPDEVRNQMHSDALRRTQ